MLELRSTSKCRKQLVHHKPTEEKVCSQRLQVPRVRKRTIQHYTCYICNSRYLMEILLYNYSFDEKYEHFSKNFYLGIFGGYNYCSTENLAILGPDLTIIMGESTGSNFFFSMATLDECKALLALSRGDRSTHGDLYPTNHLPSNCHVRSQVFV